MKKPRWGLFFLILMISCLDDPDCFQLQNNFIGIIFRVMGTGRADSTLLKEVEVPPKNVFTFRVAEELNYFEDQINLLFKGEKRDNFMSLGYNVKNQYVSEECGSRFVLSDLKILEHDFDSVRIVNSTPAPAEGGTHVEIYRCPRADSLIIDFNQLNATSNGILISNRSSRYTSHLFEKVTDSLGALLFSGREATLNLPVNLSKNRSFFVFTTDQGQDTLIVGYQLTTEQRYRPCGVQTFVSDLEIIKETFDSLAFALNDDDEQQRTLSDPHQSNIRIYDCPQLNLLRVNFELTAGTAQTILIKSVTSDHFSGNLLKVPVTVNTLNLPVDTNSDVSTFYIQYENKTDTLSVRYTRTPTTLFSTCGSEMLIRGLTENENLPNDKANVISTATTLQFPPVPNVEIITD